MNKITLKIILLILIFMTYAAKQVNAMRTQEFIMDDAYISKPSLISQALDRNYIESRYSKPANGNYVQFGGDTKSDTSETPISNDNLPVNITVIPSMSLTMNVDVITFENMPLSSSREKLSALKLTVQSNNTYLIKVTTSGDFIGNNPSNKINANLLKIRQSGEEYKSLVSGGEVTVISDQDDTNLRIHDLDFKFEGNREIVQDSYSIDLFFTMSQIDS